MFPDRQQQVITTHLRLYAIGKTLGYQAGTFLGIMSLTFRQAQSCPLTTCGFQADVTTVTSFPTGTIDAAGTHIAVGLLTGLLVPIQGGTGAFEGVSGSIRIAPDDEARAVYHLTLPG